MSVIQAVAESRESDRKAGESHGCILSSILIFFIRSLIANVFVLFTNHDN